MPLKIIKNLELLIKDGASSLLRLFLRQAPAELPSAPQRILFFRHDRLGDMILSLPVFSTIRRKYPRAILDVLCSPANYKILEDSDLADNLYIYQKNTFLLVKWVMVLRKNKYDLIINLITHSSFTFGMVARLIGPKSVRIAGHQEQFAYLYNHPVALPPKNTIPMLEMKYLLCEELAGKLPDRLPVPWVSYGTDVKSKASNIKEEIFYKLKRTGPARLAGINLSAGMARREWPLDKYEQFLKKAINRYTQQIDGWAIFTNPLDPLKADQLLPVVNSEKLIAIPAQDDFRVILALLPVFTMIFSPDTAMIHAASATGVPVLLMTIGQSAGVWEPYGVPFEVVTAADYYSLADLPVDEVLEGFDRLLKKLSI